MSKAPHPGEHHRHPVFVGRLDHVEVRVLQHREVVLGGRPVIARTSVAVPVDGVTAASADREAATATVEGSPPTDALIAAVEDAGYESTA